MTPGTHADEGGRGLPASAPIERWEALCVVGLVVFAGLLRVVGLGGQALWYDEAWTFDLARSPLGLMLERIPQWESTPPLYYLLSWVGVRLLGEGEVAVRLPAALAGTATVPAVWAAARVFSGRSAGLAAAALTACSPFMWWYSQEARAYSLAALFAALALWAMGRSLRSAAWRDLLLWAGMSMLAVISQYPAGLVFAISGAILFAKLEGFRARVVAAALVPIAVGVALVPLAVEQRSTGRSNWIAEFPIGGRVEQLFSQFWFGSPVFSSGWGLRGAAAVGLAAVVGAGVAARRRSGQLGVGVLVPAGVAAGTVAAVGVAAIAGTDLLLARNLIVVWPAAAVAVAGCIAACGKRFAVIGTSAACVAMLGLIAVVQLDPDRRRYDFRIAAELLGDRSPGGRLVVWQSFPHSRPLTVYVDGLERPGRGPVVVAEVDVVSMELPGPRWCWWGGVCSDGIRRDYSSKPIIRDSYFGFRRVAVRRKGRFAVVEYRSPAPRRVLPSAIRELTPEQLRGAVMLQR